MSTKIEVGVDVIVRHKKMKRQGVVMRRSTARRPGNRGTYWWIRLYGKERLHVRYAKKDIVVVEAKQDSSYF